ncbi:MAG: transglutaminase domain-containing protein [Thermoleophilia bacterium]
MPRLHAKHRTEIAYAGPAGESVNEIRLTPRDNGRQRVEWSHVRVDPAAELFGHVDSFGNRVSWFQLVDAHPLLVVESEAVVETRPCVPLSDVDGPPLSDLDDPAYVDRAAEFLSTSAHVRWGEPIAAFADGLGVAEDLTVPEWARAVESAVNRAITYTPGATRVDTPVEEVVRVARGVCQDLAHLMIAVCRRRGLGARYVSGWLYEPGREGPGESHAWIEVDIPGIGWREMDPTHPGADYEHYVRLAVGRDYADVPPLRGSYLGPPTERMTVSVEVREIPA